MSDLHHEDEAAPPHRTPKAASRLGDKILIAVGVGIYIMGRYTENPGQRSSGLSLLKIGAILFVIFAGFFEMIFNSFAFSRFLFPTALILFGIYLILGRSRSLAKPQDTPVEVIESSPNAEEK